MAVDRPQEAVLLLEELLPMHEAVYGRDNLYLNLRHNLASALRALGQNEQAEPILRDTIELRAALFGASNPATLSLRHDLGMLCAQTGRLDEAEERVTEVLEERIEVLGPAHPETCQSWRNLADVYQRQGRAGEAEDLRRELVEICTDELGPDGAETLRARVELASQLLEQEGGTREAEGILVEVWSSREDEARELGVPGLLARACEALGREDEARAWSERQ